MGKTKKLPTITIKKEWCKGCAICSEFCPKDVLALKAGCVEVINLEACTGCKLCEIRCPDFAITVKKNE